MPAMCVGRRIWRLRLKPHINAMTDENVYPKAPITEAILDIRVAPRSETSGLLDELAAFIKVHADAYPDVREQVLGKTSIILEGDALPQTSSQAARNGFVAFTGDHGRAMQARLDGFSASKLAPYIDWCDLRREALSLWTDYRNAVNPVLITRIALRYINRINIPLPIFDFKDYIRTTPEVSPELPQGISRFFMQLHLPQPDLDVMCILNTAMLPPIHPETVSILFDIDLFKTASVPQEDQEICLLLEKMRKRKNLIFEGSITNKTRELFR
jgi:uncharacterized protein (TIGR04255 family)